MGERFGESVWDGWAQEQSEKRIAEMTAQKVLEAQRKTTPTHLPRHYSPPTVKDVLLKTWAQDTEAMAKTLVIQSWSGGWYSVKVTENSEIECEIHDTQAEAIAVTVAYLNSAAEVGKNV